MKGFAPNTKNRVRRDKKKLRLTTSATVLKPLVNHEKTGPRSLKKAKQLARAEAHTAREQAAKLALLAEVVPRGKRAMQID